MWEDPGPKLKLMKLKVAEATFRDQLDVHKAVKGHECKQLA